MNFGCQKFQKVRCAISGSGLSCGSGRSKGQRPIFQGPRVGLSIIGSLIHISFCSFSEGAQLVVEVEDVTADVESEFEAYSPGAQLPSYISSSSE